MKKYIFIFLILFLIGCKSEECCVVGGSFNNNTNANPVVPEPATVAMFAIGAGAIAFMKRKK